MLIELAQLGEETLSFFKKLFVKQQPQPQQQQQQRQQQQQLRKLNYIHFSKNLTQT